MKPVCAMICGMQFLWLAVACSTSAKLKNIRTGASDASISLQQQERPVELSTDNGPRPQDTIIVKDLNGKDVFLMRAVQDNDGEMIASEVLEPAVITATFRNVAERMGKVDLAFRIHVPAPLQDPSWQLRFYPILIIQQDSLQLDPVHVTGSAYREKQLRGYRQYEAFLNSIIKDSSLLRNEQQIRRFWERNYEKIASVDVRQVLTHYQWSGRIRRNNRRQARAEEVFRRKVKNPLPEYNLYLDTLHRGEFQEIPVDYTYTLNTRPHLRKAELMLWGEIWREGERLYTMPATAPLTFYISSISTLLEEKTRYVQRIIERKASSNTVAYLDFHQGSTEIDTCLHENAYELARIEGNIMELVANETYDIDSLVITSTCSPEGSYLLNTRLARERGDAVRQYFEAFVERQKTLYQEEKQQTIYLVCDSSLMTSPLYDFSLLTRSIPEDWQRLADLIRKDSLLQQPQALLELIESPLPEDIKEIKIRQMPDYPRLYQVLYPLMRTVRFDFHLHRKGMVKDTLHTTETDTTYEAGLQALRERDFEKALARLRPYEDYNTALACLCLDYNHTARSILEHLPPGGKREYLLAMACARLNDIPTALEHLLLSVEYDPSLRFRGNLDPEIAQLIREYRLFEQ